MPKANTSTDQISYFKGGGEMGQLIRSYDWSQTNLGEPSTWPRSLIFSIKLILNSKYPMFIWWGPDFVQFYNDAYRVILGDRGKHPLALGQTGAACWPEIWQVIEPLVEQVMSGGESVWQEDSLIPIFRNGKLENVYWTFGYSKIEDESDFNLGGVLVVCSETTTKIKSHESIIENNRLQNRLNFNLNITNKNLAETNRKLGQTQKELRKLVHEIIDSESRFRNMIEQAPAAIGTLKGPNLIIESANEKLLSLWGKTSSIINKPLIDGLPEIKGQPFLHLLNIVYTSGKPFYGNEVLAELEHQNVLRKFYFNFVYQPLKNGFGNITGVIIVAVDVTEIVLAKKQIEESEEELRTLLNSITQISWTNTPGGEVDFYNQSWYDYTGKSFEDTAAWGWKSLVHPDDLDSMLKNYLALLESKKSGEYEVRIKNVFGHFRWHLARLRPVKVLKEVNYWVGTATDIQELKMAQQRKDEIIGIASHALKTPITSLKASLQLLERMKDDTSKNDMMSKLIVQANKSIDKVNSQVDELLNLGNVSNENLPLNITTFQISELYDSCNCLEKKGNQVLVFDSDIDLLINADKPRIDQVVVNFLNNAIKYAPDSKEIVFSVIKETNFIKVSVSDNGPGISPNKIPHLFDLHYQANKSTRSSGLGLFICSDIIKRHGGEIGVNSEMGKGSTFWFTLPQNT